MKKFAIGGGTSLALVVFLWACGGIDLCPPFCPPEPDAPYNCANPPELTGQFVRVKDALPDKVVVVLKKELRGIQALSQIQGVVSRFSGLRDVKTFSQLGQFAATANAALVTQLLADPAVDYVSQVGTKHTMVEWGLDRVDQRDLPRDGVYDPGACGAGVVVAIIDTGLDPDHKEFEGRVYPECYTSVVFRGCYDEHSHGTHVAGTVGGTEYGVAKCVTIATGRALGKDGSGSDADVIDNINWVMGQQQEDGRPWVINMSLGGPPMPALDAAVCAAIDAGISVAVAAGNESSPAYSSSPARVVQTLCAGAMDENDKGAYFSNDGPGLDVWAPGVNVRSAKPGGGSAVKDGTSMASPHVAGAAALYLERHPGSTPAEVEAGLIAAATPDKLGSSISDDSPDLLPYVKEP